MASGHARSSRRHATDATPCRAVRRACAPPANPITLPLPPLLV